MTQKRKIGLLIIVFVALICIYMWVRAWNQSEQAQAKYNDTNYRYRRR